MSVRDLLRNLRRRLARNGGFSLIEVLVALTILAIIVGIVGPRAATFLGKSKEKAAGLQMKSIQSSLELFYVDTGNYPSESAGLAALVTAPSGVKSWAGPYIDDPQALQDPWGRPYIYKVPGQSRPYEISTLGRDGRDGGSGEDGDIKY
ncbi:type II secretion system major pseudopilin GspG [Pannonibacter tanglangensis]|uniref:Type II secretion system core protein G n=1 Tax=Pannonibacter tanglangensis TaxID=2750084 RepID=A0ABW9ZPR1_9HYPH|nr:type II secretion system major pseudopilin GspG [Pannonibacter sp. XCT-34]NBN66073.1 type II secretion system major pseudopilin GspG [Pannonibacter sp. XCT-34]